MAWKSGVKKRKEARVLLGLGPQYSVKVKLLTKMEHTCECVAFLMEIKSSVSDVVSVNYLFTTKWGHSNMSLVPLS